MSWLDDVGDFFEETGESIGHAYSAATDNGFADMVRSTSFLKQDKETGVYGPNADFPGARTAGAFGGNVLDVASWPGQQVQRGATTAYLAGDMPGGPFSARSWEQAWDIADNVGFGDAIFAPSVATLTNPAEYEKWKGTWGSRLTAGATNFLSEVFMDPVGGAVGAVSEARKVSATLQGAAETRQALRVAAGEANKTQVTRREWKFGQKFQQYLDATDGKTASELMDTPMFQESPDGGALAYLFERANKSYPGDTKEALEARRRVKRDILGSAMGDVGSIQRLGGRRDALANELHRMGQLPEPTSHLEKFTWDDHGQSALRAANAESDPAMEAAREGIEAEITRLDRAYAQQGTINQVPSTRGLKETVLFPGLASRPVHVVTGALHDSGANVARPRLTGNVSTKDVTVGYQQLSEYLRQSRYVDPKIKRDLQDRFVRAATPGERSALVGEAEKRMFEGYSKQYGLTTEQAEEFFKAAQGRRNAFLQLCSERLYSAAPDAKFIDVIDPEDSVTKAISRPLMVSQIEDSAQITPPAMLEKALKRNTTTGFIQAFADRTKLRKTSQDFADVAEDGMTMLTRGWKDLALFRPAYPLRVQVDTQMRLMASMGALPYLKQLPGAGRGLLHYTLSKKGEEGLSLRNFFREGDLESALLKGQGKGGALADAEEAAKFVRLAGSEPGGMADLASSYAVDDLKRLRGTGSWGSVSTGDLNWLDSWHRAVDRQVKNSPTAMRILAGGGDTSVYGFVNTDPAAREEWLNLRGSWGGDKTAWISSLRKAVNHLLPNQELRDYTTKRLHAALQAGDVETAAYALGRRKDLAQDVTPLTGQAELDQAAVDELKAAVATARAAVDEQRATIAEMRKSGTTVAELRDAKQQLSGLRAEAKAARERVAEARIPARSSTRAAVAVEKQAAGATAVAQQRTTEKVRGWTVKDVDAHFANEANRMPVHGESYMTTVRSPMTARIEKFRRSWYQFASDAPETILGRHPFYQYRFNERVRVQLDQLGKTQDTLTGEEMARIRQNAAVQARRDIKKVLFDTSDVSNLAHHARFVSPFFAAWEDTMKKWGKLLWENPKAGVRMSNIFPAARSTGAVVDSEGNRVDARGRTWNVQGEQVTDPEYRGYGQFVIMPNFLKPLGVPGQDWRVNMKSANIIFQGEPWWLPGFGPTVQIPANKIVRSSFPDEAENPILKFVLPYGVTEDPSYVQALPSWARQARHVFGNTQDYANTYTRIGQVEMVKYNLGQRETKPGPGEIANKTRLWFVMRAVTAASSPVTAAPSPEFQFYIDRYRDLQRERSQDQDAWEKNHNGMSPQEVFYDKYPDYFDLTVSLSANTTGIEASQEAWRESDKPWVRRLTAADPKYGWMFVGAQNLVGDYDKNVYAAQKGEQVGYGSTETFRGARQPAEAMRSVEAERGWIEYSRARELVDQALNARGLYSLQAKGAADIKAGWDEFVTGLASENPAWSEERATDVDQVAELAAVARRSARDSKKFAQRSDYQTLDIYMQARTMVKKHLSGLKYSSLERNPEVQEAWNEFVSELVASDLGFKQMFDRSLERDDLSANVVW